MLPPAAAHSVAPPSKGPSCSLWQPEETSPRGPLCPPARHRQLQSQDSIRNGLTPNLPGLDPADVKRSLRSGSGSRAWLRRLIWLWPGKACSPACGGRGTSKRRWPGQLSRTDHFRNRRPGRGRRRWWRGAASSPASKTKNCFGTGLQVAEGPVGRGRKWRLQPGNLSRRPIVRQTSPGRTREANESALQCHK